MNDYDDLADLIETSLVESVTLLELAIDRAGKGIENPTALDEVYRAVHTVKANMVLIPNSQSISLFMKSLEAMLGDMRDGKRALDLSLLSCIEKGLEAAHGVLKNHHQPERQREMQKVLMKALLDLRKF